MTEPPWPPTPLLTPDPLSGDKLPTLESARSVMQKEPSRESSIGEAVAVGAADWVAPRHVDVPVGVGWGGGD